MSQLNFERIKLVLSDNDGVMTDHGVYYSDQGEVMKRFSIRDGMGVERLRQVGIETVIITGELSGSVKTRAEKLKMKWLYVGIKDKANKLTEIISETGIQPHEMAYIGDDVNDMGIMEIIKSNGGIIATPSDGMDSVKPLANYICKQPGGHGAFREFAEWIISNRVK